MLIVAISRQRLSNSRMHQNLKCLLKQIARTHSSVSDIRNFGWIQKFAFLVNSHMMLMLLVWGPYFENHFQLVQSLCHVRLFASTGTAACQASLSIASSQSLLKLMSIESVIPSNISSSVVPPSIFPSIGVFSKKSVLHIRWPKYWSFSFSISPSNEYSALISFMMDWFDLPEVQGTLKNLLQHHSLKCINSSALSFLYSPTLTSIYDYWKNHSSD